MLDSGIPHRNTDKLLDCQIIQRFKEDADDTLHRSPPSRSP